MVKQIGNWYPVPRDQEVLFESLPTPSPVPLSISTHPAPDTDLARKVDQFAKKHLTGPQYNHSRRIYHFGLAIIDASFPHWLDSSKKPLSKEGGIGIEKDEKDQKDGEGEGGVEVDRETWFITCLMHDIGLAEAYHLTTKMSFEVRHLVSFLF